MHATYVLVHGSFSNSFSWAPVQRELTLLGHRAVAVDLPGHGFEAAFSRAYQAPQDLAALASAPAAVGGVAVEDNVARVVETVRRAAGHGPVVLVGHSAGGLTVSGVAAAVPELLHRLVYISAWCCVDATQAEYAQGPEYATSELHETGALLVGDPAQSGAIRLNWRTADAGMLAVLKEAIAADLTEEEFLAYLNLLEPDESLALGATEARVEAATWGRIPRTYVRLTGDRSIPPALQDRFIKEADALTPDNPFDVRSVDSSHSGFLVRGTEVAGILAELAPGA